MEFSPAVRHALTIAAIIVGALSATLGTQESLPDGVSIALTTLSLIFAGFGIIPGQVGGTQKGIVSPTAVDVPPSDNIQTR